MELPRQKFLFVQSLESINERSAYSMARAFLVVEGGGGTSSDELTALASDVFNDKTAVTKDSNDEAIRGTGVSMDGGTYTPSTSQITISCAGKRMRSNVVVRAIPAMAGATYTPSPSQQTISCAGKWMTGNIIIEAMPNMNGGTYTPSTSTQTISCSGKYMNSNVIINAIPASFISPTSGQLNFSPPI